MAKSGSDDVEILSINGKDTTCTSQTDSFEYKSDVEVSNIAYNEICPPTNDEDYREASERNEEHSCHNDSGADAIVEDGYKSDISVSDNETHDRLRRQESSGYEESGEDEDSDEEEDETVDEDDQVDEEEKEGEEEVEVEVEEEDDIAEDVDEKKVAKVEVAKEGNEEEDGNESEDGSEDEEGNEDDESHVTESEEPIQQINGKGNLEDDGWVEQAVDNISIQAEEEDKDDKSPMFVPKRTGFWDHDDRCEDTPIEKSRPRPREGRKLWDRTVERWEHDKYREDEQAPKTEQEKEDARREQQEMWNQRRRNRRDLGDFIENAQGEQRSGDVRLQRRPPQREFGQNRDNNSPEGNWNEEERRRYSDGPPGKSFGGNRDYQRRPPQREFGQNRENNSPEGHWNEGERRRHSDGPTERSFGGNRNYQKASGEGFQSGRRWGQNENETRGWQRDVTHEQDGGWKGRNGVRREEGRREEGRREEGRREEVKREEGRREEGGNVYREEGKTGRDNRNVMHRTEKSPNMPPRQRFNNRDQTKWREGNKENDAERVGGQYRGEQRTNVRRNNFNEEEERDISSRGRRVENKKQKDINVETEFWWDDHDTFAKSTDDTFVKSTEDLDDFNEQQEAEEEAKEDSFRKQKTKHWVENDNRRNRNEKPERENRQSNDRNEKPERENRHSSDRNEKPERENRHSSDRDDIYYTERVSKTKRSDGASRSRTVEYESDEASRSRTVDYEAREEYSSRGRGKGITSERLNKASKTAQDFDQERGKKNRRREQRSRKQSSEEEDDDDDENEKYQDADDDESPHAEERRPYRKEESPPETSQKRTSNKPKRYSSQRIRQTNNSLEANHENIAEDSHETVPAGHQYYGSTNYPQQQQQPQVHPQVIAFLQQQIQTLQLQQQHMQLQFQQNQRQQHQRQQQQQQPPQQQQQQPPTTQNFQQQGPIPVLPSSDVHGELPTHAQQQQQQMFQQQIQQIQLQQYNQIRQRQQELIAANSSVPQPEIPEQEMVMPNSSYPTGTSASLPQVASNSYPTGTSVSLPQVAPNSYPTGTAASLPQVAPNSYPTGTAPLSQAPPVIFANQTSQQQLPGIYQQINAQNNPQYAQFLMNQIAAARMYNPQQQQMGLFIPPAQQIPQMHEESADQFQRKLRSAAIPIKPPPGTT